MHYSSLLLCASLAAFAAAQGPTLSTKTSVGVYARSATGVDHEAIAPATPITTGQRVEAQIDMVGAVLAAGPGMTTDSFMLHTMGHAGSSMMGSGEAGTTPAPQNTRPVQGPVAFLLTWRGDARRFHLTMEGEVDDATAGVALDVGDDGTFEFRQAVDGNAHHFGFVLGGHGATVAAVVLTGHAQPSSSSMRSLYALRVLLGAEGGRHPCEFTNYGVGCDGMTLSGVDRGSGMMLHDIELTVHGAFPDRPVMLMFGVQRTDVPVHGDCRLLVAPLVGVVYRADAQGNLVQRFSGGSELNGAMLLMQAAAMGRMMDLRLSNGTHMDCGMMR